MGNGANTSIGGMHDILFRQLEALANEDLKGEELEIEMKRTDAMCKITGQIIDNGRLAIKVAEMKREFGQVEPEVGYLIEKKDKG